jgi:hypothetical protein
MAEDNTIPNGPDKYLSSLFLKDEEENCAKWAISQLTNEKNVPENLSELFSILSSGNRRKPRRMN